MKREKQLGFGLMRLPKKDGSIDVEATARLADMFMDGGFTYFDTAYVYEGSEEDSADEYRLSGLQQGLNGILEGQSEWEGSASQLLTLARSWSGREVAKSPRALVELLFRCEQRMKELDGISLISMKKYTNKTLYRIVRT